MTAPGSTLPPIRYVDLAQALLRDAANLVPRWLPGGKRVGPEWVCGSSAGDSGRSFSVNVVKGKWADFQNRDEICGKDLISLYAEIHGLGQHEAALAVAEEEGLEDVAGIVRRKGGAPPPPRPPRPPPPPGPPPAEREQWTPVVPVPATALQPTFWHHERKNPVHKARYAAGDDLYGYVVRFMGSDGRKITMPYVWASSSRDGSQKWVWRGWEEPRPLFYPGGQAPQGRTVIVVEGEIKGEVLQTLLDAHMPGVYCVASWPNGSKSWRKADWSWLAGSTVLLWPDCDSKREDLSKAERKAIEAKVVEAMTPEQSADPEARAEAVSAAFQAAAAVKPYLPADKQPGKAAMLGIGAHLRDDHACTVSMLPCAEPGVRPDGWDARDAIEADGWGIAQVMDYFGQSVALLAQVPADPAAGAGSGDGGGGRKKTDPPAAAEDDDKLPWWLRPYWDADKCRWYVSRKLVITALTHDEQLHAICGYNQLSNSIDARRAWPWPHAKPGPLTGAVALLLGQYLSRRYGVSSISRQALEEAIETVAHESPFHPVQDYLLSLEWDSTPRIDKWLVYAIGEAPDTLPAPVYEYLCLVSRYWLLGMVNRVMEPGCKFDYCPVLEGPGGLGKSTLVEVLASVAWFSDTHFDVGRGKDGQEQVQGLWVYEIAELANFGKAEIALIKAFISAKVDRYRPAYGRTVEAYARQCVMVGTTNERTYLRDRTGNRRFWPIPVKQRVRIGWVRKWRDQLLAEAFMLYQQGAQYYPDPAQEERLFVPMQESRLVETAVLSELLHVLTRDPVQNGIGAVVNNLTEFVTMSQLALALGVDAAKSNAALEGQIRSWLDHQGWERVKKQINGARAWGYVRPKGWPPEEPDDTGVTTAPRTSTPEAGAPSAAADYLAQQEDADDAPF